MVGESLPGNRIVEIEGDRAAEESRFIEDDDAHLVGEIEVVAWVDLGVKADGVSTHLFDHAVPGPGISAGHDKGAEGMEQVGIEWDFDAVEEETAADDFELTPAEARTAAVETAAVLVEREDGGIEIRSVGGPELEAPGGGLAEGDGDGFAWL